MTALKKLFAWAVHLYTALGGVFALLAVIAISQNDFAGAMIWLMVCFFIDGTDGILARQARVRELVPIIDGQNIDYVTDFITYAFVPAYFVYQSALVPPDFRLPLAGYIILISAFYYGRKGMISQKGQFSGFPVLWNLVVFYTFFVFESTPIFNIIFILVFGILHFLPIQVSYPSKNLKKNPLPFIIGTSMLIVFIATLVLYPATYLIFKLIALAAFAYFIYLTIYFTWIKWRADLILRNFLLLSCWSPNYINENTTMVNKKKGELLL